MHQVSQHCDCAMRAKVIIIFPNDHLYRAFKTTECCPALFHNQEKRAVFFFLEIFFFRKYLFLVVLGPRCSLRALSSCSERELLFSCGVGFSLLWLLLLQSIALGCEGFSSCGA